MGKSSRPWMNYKSNQPDATIPTRQYKTKRSYKKALMYLVFLGFAGGHKFYLYDEKQGWKIFGAYAFLILVASLLKPFLAATPFIVIFSLAVYIIYSAYPTLKQDVERVNQEIMND